MVAGPKNPHSPRLGLLCIARILVLHSLGKTFTEIAASNHVCKKDGTRLSRQGVSYVVKTNKRKKKSGQFLPGQRRGGGRPKVLSEEEKKAIVAVVEKYRFKRVRAPWVKKYLKLRCSLRTVRRVINESGYTLPLLVNKRALDNSTKKKRVKWAEEHAKFGADFWKRRAYGDGHSWYMPRNLSELQSLQGKAGAIYRKKNESKDPRFHGRPGSTSYKQGRKVGVFGVLTADKLAVSFIPDGTLRGSSFATIVRKGFPTWLNGRRNVVLDGERSMHGKCAKDALKDVKKKVMPLPPNSCDWNPIENVWAFLDKRLNDTAPSKLETPVAFKSRVRNAVKWLNKNHNKDDKTSFDNTVSSMPRRLAEGLKIKGARTGY
jgi:transposase